MMGEQWEQFEEQLGNLLGTHEDNMFQDKFTKIILCGWIVGKVLFFGVVKAMNRI
jgi:hypothetical protein